MKKVIFKNGKNYAITSSVNYLYGCKNRAEVITLNGNFESAEEVVRYLIAYVGGSKCDFIIINK